MDLQRLLTPEARFEHYSDEREQSAPLAAQPDSATPQWNAINTVRSGVSSKPLPVDMVAHLGHGPLTAARRQQHEQARSAVSTPACGATSPSAHQLPLASRLVQTTSTPVPIFTPQPASLPPLHHPVPQTPIRLEEKSRRWSAQWTHQAQLLGLVPASQHVTPVATPSQEAESEKISAMVVEMHSRFEERVSALERDLMQREKEWESRVNALERACGDKIAFLERSVSHARGETGSLREWKGEVERRVQMQADVVGELVRRVIGLEKSEQGMGQVLGDIGSMEDDVGGRPSETPVRTERVGHTFSPCGAVNFPSPMSMSPRGPPDDTDFDPGDDGLPSPQGTPCSPFMLSSHSMPKRSTGKKVTKHRHQASTIEPPPTIDELPSTTGTKGTCTLKPASMTRFKPSRPLAKVSQTAQSLPDPQQPSKQSQHLSGSQASTPRSKVPKARPFDPPSTVKASSLMTTLPDGTQAPIFIFHKHPDTVQEQWDEYERGFAGQRAVRWLDETYTTKWRRDTYARTWYSRRKKFWDLCKEVMKGGMGEEAALARVEDLMGGMSVAGFVDYLGHQKRERKKDARAFLGGNEAYSATDLTEGLGSARRRAKRNRPARKVAVVADEGEEGLAIESPSEDEQRAHKRRSSLRLRGREIQPPLADEESSDDSDSVVEW